MPASPLQALSEAMQAIPKELPQLGRTFQNSGKSVTEQLAGMGRSAVRTAFRGPQMSESAAVKNSFTKIQTLESSIAKIPRPTVRTPVSQAELAEMQEYMGIYKELSKEMPLDAMKTALKNAKSSARRGGFKKFYITAAVTLTFMGASIYQIFDDPKLRDDFWEELLIGHNDDVHSVFGIFVMVLTVFNPHALIKNKVDALTALAKTFKNAADINGEDIEVLADRFKELSGIVGNLLSTETGDPIYKNLSILEEQ